MVPKPAAFTLRFPLGVISHNGTAAYIGDETPDIVALDLQTGRVLWRTATCGRPIATGGQHVVVARQSPDHALELDVLSTDDGKLLSTLSVQGPFPDWVEATLRPNERFIYRCALESANLDLEWRANQRYAGGAPPSPQVLERERRSASGVLHIDLASGRLMSEAREMDLPANDAEPIPNLETPAREVCAHGECVYYLLDQSIDASSGRTTLRAVRSSTRKPLWEFAVRNWKTSRPRALRP